MRIVCLWVLLCGWGVCRAGVAPDQVPTFKLRARVAKVAGAAPPAGQKYTFRIAHAAATSTADGWTDWISFDRARVDQILKEYPNLYMDGYPVVTHLELESAGPSTQVEAEAKLDETGGTSKLEADLFGPSVGVVIDRDAGHAPRVQTMAGYNRQYWKVLDGADVPADKRPRRFPIVDRFIGGDDDRINWTEGLTNLSRAGFSAVAVEPREPLRELLAATPVKRTSWAVYSPPGYVFPWGEAGQPAPQSPDAWAKAQAKSYTDAGFDVHAFATFALSDEPGWYYPASFKALEKPEWLDRFHQYLQSQGLKPVDVGAAGWAAVKPIGRSRATDLPSRRLFYWTMRFFPHASAEYFAETTRAMESAFYPGLPLTTNWNFFAGRLYVPGPVANNADKKSPDAAMGGHDPFEFARLRGCTTLWTEDWFPDAQAYQWSFYAARLRSAAAKGNLTFGGYVVPRAAGDRDDGLVQKMLCLAGSGAKAIDTYVFGPEYNFPGNCYSARPELLRKLAEANGMIGAAEDVLWPGKRPPARVALLAPRSAELWDEKNVPIPTDIQDATATNLNAATVDYMAEVFDLYVALQHANIPVDFVDEDDLAGDGMNAYRVLYVTEPDLPAESQEGLARWVREQGGTVVTTSGAAAADRYDEPCDVLAKATGLGEAPRERILVGDLNALPEAGKVRVGSTQVSAVGVRGKLNPADGQVLAEFADGAPAVVRRPVGRGSAVHFAWMPGMSYFRSATEKRDKLPAGFSADLRRLITTPVRLAHVEAPVGAGTALVETPLLLSDAGAAITCLNWNGIPIARLDLEARLPFRPRSVVSLRRGPLPFDVQGDVTVFRLPVDDADILVLKP